MEIGENRGFRVVFEALQASDCGSTSPKQTLKPGCGRVLSENFSSIGSAIPNPLLGKEKERRRRKTTTITTITTNILTNVNG